MSNKIYPEAQKVINNKFKTELLKDKNYILESSIKLINDSIDILLGVWKLTPREIEVILNTTISKIREHKDYNRNDSMSDLLAFLHSDKKDDLEIKKQLSEKPHCASRSDLLGDLTKGD